MSDSLNLYDTLLLAIRKANPDEDPRRQQVFAWAVVGLLLEKSIRLTTMALVIVSAAKAASRVRRLSCFLANPHVQVRAYYDALLCQALAGWAGATLYLVLDTTTLAGKVGSCGFRWSTAAERSPWSGRCMSGNGSPCLLRLTKRCSRASAPGCLPTAG
jgi:hypothetical protein